MSVRPVWSESLLSVWRKLGPLSIHWMHNEDWSDWADAQADLSLRWAHTHFVGFVMLWLKCFLVIYNENQVAVISSCENWILWLIHVLKPLLKTIFIKNISKFIFTHVSRALHCLLYMYETLWWKLSRLCLFPFACLFSFFQFDGLYGIHELHVPVFFIWARARDNK